MQKPKYTAVAIHALVWCALLVLPYVFIGSHSRYGQAVCNFFTLSNLIHIGLFYLNASFLYTRFLTRRKWWIYVLLIGILIPVVYSAKLLMLRSWFPELAGESAMVAATFFPIIFFLVISMLYRLIVDKMDAEKNKLAAELRFLRSQVSPHFLFNVLNNLVSMARHNSDLLEPSLIRLSALMRYMLYEVNENRVSLATEVGYLQSYIELQKMRFEDDIDIRFDLLYIPNGETIEPMLLIPLVENAFKHGVADVNDAFITISLRISDDLLVFDVKNRFSREPGSKDTSSGIGLNNLEARLNLLYPGRHEFTTSHFEGVFKANLTIKLNE